MHKPVVVFGLLDWGLGHTTRSIPIIRHLIEINCNVIVACNSWQKDLLAKEFSEISFLPLEGYSISYRNTPIATRLSLLFQIPKILTKIKRENRYLLEYLAQSGADLIISDNRFGFYSSTIPSVFITHQLGIQTGLGKWADQLARWFNYRLLKKFQHCWIPDFAGKDNLAGLLSHPSEKAPIPVSYLGALSRFEPCHPSIEPSAFILIILSGPEPQRSILETLLMSQSATINREIVLVRGLPQHRDIPTHFPPHVKVFNHLPAVELNRYLCKAGLVISRSGYTSVMDYIKLGIRAILIPTPGQAEQEYLAAYLQQKKLAISCSQEKFDLARMMEKAGHFEYAKLEADPDHFKNVISDYVGCLRNN